MGLRYTWHLKTFLDRNSSSSKITNNDDDGVLRRTTSKQGRRSQRGQGKCPTPSFGTSVKTISQPTEADYALLKCPTRFSDLPTALKQASHSHLENDFVSSFIATIELWPCKHFGVSLTSDLFFLIFDSRENMARALFGSIKALLAFNIPFFLKVLVFESSDITNDCDGNFFYYSYY